MILKVTINTTEYYKYKEYQEKQNYKYSGSGFYIEDNLDFIDRPDLDKHEKDKLNEFTAKWIEIKNKKGSNVLIASIYRHPGKKIPYFMIT